MAYLRSTTLEELDRLEHMYSTKGNRLSKNIRSRIGDHERLIFCYYELRDGTIAIYILTDVQLIFSSVNPILVHEISLDRVKNITVNYGRRFGSGGIRVFFDGTSDVMFFGFKNDYFLDGISSTIMNAKANFGLQSHSSPIPYDVPVIPSQNSLAEQLEELSRLYKCGVLTDDEFKLAKEKILSSD